MYGLRVADLVTGSTINCAVLIGGSAAAAGNWGIYQANSTANNFGGAINFKTIDRSTTLDLSSGTNGTANMIINCTSGTFTITLPAAASVVNGRTYWIYNSGAGTITIARNGSNIAGAAADITLVGANTKAMLTLSNASTNWVRWV
jgi:hypothetical protein